MPSEAAQHVFDKLANEITEESMLPVLIEEKRTRAVYGKAVVQSPSKDGELTARTFAVSRVGVDMYGLEKPTATKYYKCTNCDRSVAGGRLAAHVTKCITRGRRQRTTYI